MFVRDYGIRCRSLSTYDSISFDDPTPVPPVIDGPVLISAGDLNGFEFGSSVLNPYEAFRGVKPAAYVRCSCGGGAEGRGAGAVSRGNDKGEIDR